MNSRLDHPQDHVSCFHCGQDVPEGTHFSVVVKGQNQPMCCPGCQAVTETIIQSGLEHYYKHRQGEAGLIPEMTGAELPSAVKDELQLYNNPNIQKEFVISLEEDVKEASLVIEGITCAACVWLLEHHLVKQPGVTQASVNLTNHRARIRWRANEIALSDIMSAIYKIGYQGHPYNPDKEEQLFEQERKQAVRRLGIAGVGMMQVMMMAVALYAGTLQGIEDKFETFIRWTSLIIATPVVLYSAKPFFVAALRDIRTRHLSMDVPVSIAIGLAYLASVWATITQSGEVYFDSVTMFTFFLLIGRYLEMQARHRTGRAGNSLLNLLPASAIKIVEGHEALVPATELKPGDIVLVKPGHTIPADGVIKTGASSIDESALTGEYLPVSRTIGDQVVGGTINAENPIQLEVTEVGAQTRLSAIVRLLDRAHEEKPQVAKVADKVASYFVAAVLVTATIVSLVWWQIEPSHAFWVTLSVLVVTCPCALSLATPTALTAATGTLRQNGLLITRGHVLDSLATATHVVFDKTGTLTEGNLSLKSTVTLGNIDTQFALETAAALESHSEHPIAKAFHRYGIKAADSLQAELGQGLEGEVEGKRYRIGKPEYAAALCHRQMTISDAPDQHGQWLLLCDQHEPIAWFCLNDQLRKDTERTLQELKKLGLKIQMLTGDSSAAVHEIAEQLSIDTVIANVSPKEKLAHVQALQKEGARVIMVGDGINDIPVLAGAQTSIAMGGATDLAKTNADAVLIGSELSRLTDAILLSKKTQYIIRQNLGWSIMYNLLALPLASAGFIAPYMAAIGMSASSLVVVGNALRLTKLVRRNRVK
ncbi:heavy metal translocating P-type ATPase [Neptunomonas concharum]|uniref:P-type Cu(2+) transporter n=1 Tax=Neptunomonas concharum TaxID=1031538 RepID=A0A5P1RD09_9GAMM|nr:heavy metal translocating P-type ATPase metal-binding domain-containing protein [Neptunomonas concharum]QEQ97156.1 cadmium-translocating P-type ATPase [Neptunomonas concharum]